MMGYENLSLDGFIKEIVDASTGSHPRKFCFVLGAGASVTSGIMSGQKLVDLWEAELLERNADSHLKWKEELGITEKNKYEFYSSYYERRFSKQPSDGLNFMEKIMETASPNVGYVILAYILTNKPHNVVITTNFDHLVEDAISYNLETMPLVIGHESLAHYISVHKNRPTIIKIHRDLLFDPKNTPGELEELHQSWREVLGVVFSEYHPVFIGYAGNDKSLMDFLINNVDKFVSRKWAIPYWLTYGESIGEKVQSFLERSGGYLIKSNGFDDTLYELGAKLGYVFPEEKAFFEDAKKRYDKLAERFNAVTERVGSKKKSVQPEQASAAGARAEMDQAVTQITDQVKLLRHYREAIKSHNMGDYSSALKHEQVLVRLDPDNARYHDTLSTTLHAMKRYEEALAEARGAVEIEPDNARYRNSVGVTLYAMKRYEEALAEARRAVEIEPDNAKYHNSLGSTLHEMKRYEEALAEKQRTIEIEPDNAWYRDSIGITLHAMKRYEEALVEEQKAVEIEPDNARYRNNLGITLHEVKRYEEALVEKQRAIEIEPENARYHDSLSVTLHVMKRYEEALAETQRAVEIEPDNAEYHNSLGVTLHAMKRYEEALIEEQRAIEIEPDNARYRNSLSITLRAMKRYEEAEVERQRALALRPDTSESDRK